MSAIDLTTMPNPDLVREFEEIALQMSYAELRDDDKRYNELFELQVLVVDELKSRGARHLLLPLLDHKKRVVRLHAAKRTLAISPAKAREALIALRRLGLMPEAAEASFSLRKLDDGSYVPN
jgi:hypothetical protein